MSQTGAARRAYNQAYRNTPHGAAACAWNRLMTRAGAKYGHRKCYADVEVRMTRDDFVAWAVPQYSEWFFLYPRGQWSDPSVDRIDSSGHYETGNLRLIPAWTNRQNASHYRNRSASDGALWCGCCKQYLDIDQFCVDRQKKTGRNTYCKTCLNSKRKAS